MLLRLSYQIVFFTELYSLLVNLSEKNVVMVRKGNFAHIFYCFLGGNHDDSPFFCFAFVGIAPERKR